MTGCSKVSPGCLNCYAEKMANRLRAMGNRKYQNGFNFTVHSNVFSYPLRWRKPHSIFVNSMSDTFHESCTDVDILSLFQIMEEAHWHIFQVLTKRSDRMRTLVKRLLLPQNIWLGVTIESMDFSCRADHLRDTPAVLKFLSLEPLLGPLPNLNLEGIDWVIVGGESGPKARPMKKEWVVEIKELCHSYGVPFFFKQWGGVNKKQAGRLLEGRTWDDLPIVR